jgi:hypothetical protein
LHVRDARRARIKRACRSSTPGADGVLWSVTSASAEGAVEALAFPNGIHRLHCAAARSPDGAAQTDAECVAAWYDDLLRIVGGSGSSFDAAILEKLRVALDRRLAAMLVALAMS